MDTVLQKSHNDSEIHHETKLIIQWGQNIWRWRHTIVPVDFHFCDVDRSPDSVAACCRRGDGEGQPGEPVPAGGGAGGAGGDQGAARRETQDRETQDDRQEGTWGRPAENHQTGGGKTNLLLSVTFGWWDKDRVFSYSWSELGVLHQH